MTTPIQKAIAACDNSKAILARKVGVTPGMIWQWENGRRPIPATRCADIEKATGGAVTRQELRPDVFCDPPQKSEVAKLNVFGEPPRPEQGDTQEVA